MVAKYELKLTSRIFRSKDIQNHKRKPTVVAPAVHAAVKILVSSVSGTFHVFLNDVVYLGARNVTRDEPIMGLFSYFFPKLNKYIGNIKIVLTYSNTWLEIAGLSSTKNKLKSA